MAYAVLVSYWCTLDISMSNNFNNHTKWVIHVAAQNIGRSITSCTFTSIQMSISIFAVMMVINIRFLKLKSIPRVSVYNNNINVKRTVYFASNILFNENL